MVNSDRLVDLDRLENILFDIQIDAERELEDPNCEYDIYYHNQLNDVVWALGFVRDMRVEASRRIL